MSDSKKPEREEHPTANELTAEELDQASGGVRKDIDVCKTPSPPGGPVPIPYPNTTR